MKALAIAAVLMFTSIAHSQPVRLELATYFPESTLSGQWMRKFASQANELGQGALDMRVVSAASQRDAFEAVNRGRAALAGFYAPDLSVELPLLGLSAVPMLVTSIDDAWKLNKLAQPRYAQELATRNQILLATMPWRPGALWSRHPLKDKGDLVQRRLLVQTNRPRVSAGPLERLGAARSEFQAVADIVLATGYTGNLATFASTYKHFTEMTYVVQVNFITMSAAEFAKLSKMTQEAIVSAGRIMEEQEWAATKSLVARDHSDMAARGVLVLTDVPADLRQALHEAAKPDIENWVSTTAPAARQIVDAHLGK